MQVIGSKEVGSEIARAADEVQLFMYRRVTSKDAVALNHEVL
jgi:hypothetical protein